MSLSAALRIGPISTRPAILIGLIGLLSCSVDIIGVCGVGGVLLSVVVEVGTEDPTELAVECFEMR